MINVYFWQLDDQSEQIAKPLFRKLSSKEEIIKARNYRSRSASNLYISGKILQRLSLSHFDDKVAPSDWEFIFGKYGRPKVVDAQSTDIFFNVSKTKNSVVTAVCDNLIGIDLERLDANFEFDDLRPAFSTDEITQIDNGPGGVNKDKILTLWTAKEAVSKFDGRGMGLPFDQLSCVEAGKGNVTVKSYIVNNTYALSIASRTTSPVVNFFEYNCSSRSFCEGFKLSSVEDVEYYI